MAVPIYSPIVATGVALKGVKKEEKRHKKLSKNKNFIFIPFFGFVSKKNFFIKNWYKDKDK